MIGGDLEYLMTSLPYLSFDNDRESERMVVECLNEYSGHSTGDLPPTRLLEIEAAKYLSSGKSGLFNEIHLDQLHDERFINHHLPLLSGFSRFLAKLREELKALRLARRNADDPLAAEGLHSPVKPGNPLEEEISILKLQWDCIEELSAMHFADFSALIAYKLKLMLLLRLWSFDKEKGYEIFKQTTNTLS